MNLKCRRRCIHANHCRQARRRPVDLAGPLTGARLNQLTRYRTSLRTFLNTLLCFAGCPQRGLVPIFQIWAAAARQPGRKATRPQNRLTASKFKGLEIKIHPSMPIKLNRSYLLPRCNLGVAAHASISTAVCAFPDLVDQFILPARPGARQRQSAHPPRTPRDDPEGSCFFEKITVFPWLFPTVRRRSAVMFSSSHKPRSAQLRPGTRLVPNGSNKAFGQ